MEIKLGDKVRDEITGLVGIAVARIEFLNGCIQYDIQPPMNKKGEVPASEWVDVQQLEIIEPAKAKETDPNGGGNRNYP